LEVVAEAEVGETKTPYEGTLDQLYRNDFPKFIEYNRQDAMLLVKIDKKRKFIELANQIAHANGVLLKTTMGSVALVEQAIINKAHDLGFIVPDRKREIVEYEPESDDEDDEEEATPVVGAYVADPKKGLHEEVGAVDIISLYPTIIRAFNISPETLVGQIRSDETMAMIEKRITEGTPRAEAWEGVFGTLEYDHMMAHDTSMLTVDFQGGREQTFTGAELYRYIFEEGRPLCVSANGTIFRTDKNGVIPQLLTGWYAERLKLQNDVRLWSEMADGVSISSDLANLLKD
jgi:DNA polymerase elongation subunit (family B)